MVAPRPVETPSADALRAQQMAAQLRQAEEARRQAEEAARIAAENARRAAEAARKAAEEARDKAEKSRLAAEAAEKKAAQTKLEVDEKEATRLRKEAKADELDALKKEVTANLREKEHTLAASKLDDVRQRRAPTDPSEATRTAQTEVDAAKKTMALYEPPVPERPTPLDQASARTKTLFDKAQTAAKPVFAAQAAGREPSKAEVDALNLAVGNWLDAAKQDMRTAGVQAQSRGEDPNAAIDTEAKRLKQAIDDGGVFDPGKLGEYIDQNRNDVRKESPAVRQVRSEQYNVQLAGDKQVADAADGVRKADADAAAARKYADSFGTPSTDSQVTAKQDAQDEAARLAEEAQQARTRLTGLQKAFGIKDPAQPERNTVGTVEAGYNARVADLEAGDLGARYKAALDAGDQEAMKTLGPQLDDALARQKLARSLSAALTADLGLHDAGIEKDAAEAAWKAASADQPQLRTVERTGRGGKYTQTITPDGYDKTFWLDPSKEGDRKKVQLGDDGKYYLVQSGPRGGETRTELNPITARRFAAYDKLSDAQKQATDTKGALARTNEDLLGSPDGRAPPKLDYDAWIPDAKAINDKLTQADNGVKTANWNLTQAVKNGASQERLDELRQQLGTAMQTQQTARNNAEALKAITELRDAERKQAIGQDPGDLDKLRSNARAAVDKARQAPPLTPEQEKALREKTTQLGKDLEAADTKVETTRKAWEKATEPADKKAKHELYLAALDDYDKVDLQFRDGDSRLKLLDAQRAALAAPVEYEAQTFNGAFAKPQLSMFMRNGESVTADIYPQNYDPTWNLKPSKDGKVDPAGLPRGLSPDDVEVRYNPCGGGYIVTIKKDSEVVGFQKSERYGDLRHFTVKEGTYTMHPQTARLWDATNTDPGTGGSALTRAQDYRAQVLKDLQAYAADHPQPAPGASPVTGTDGKPIPALNLSDDLAARKPAVDQAVTDATDKLDSLLAARTHVTGDTGALDLQITEARAQQHVAQLEQRAVDSVLAWQAANRNRQIFEADQRAGRTTSADAKPPEETADDLRDTALKDRTAWLQGRDKHALDLARSKVTSAEQAHADWKRDHPYLLGSEKNAQTWKHLVEARGNADLAQRQLVLTANERANIDQQQLISSTLSPDEHDDPAKLYRLFMDNPQVMAQSVINAHYVQYGSQPMEMAGRTHLGNEVSFALGWQPSVELDPDSPAGNLQLRRTQNLFELDGDQKKLQDSVVDKIIEIGGERARVTVLPVVYALDGENGGIVKTALFKVEREEGAAQFVDDQGREYKDIDDFRGNNMLPVENVDLAMPEDGKYEIDGQGNVQLFTGDARTETGWENFRRTKHVDAIVGGVGFVAGVVLTVGSLGTLSVPGAVMMGAGIGMMGAGAYGVVTSAQSLSNQAEHGVSVNPFTNEQARMDWMNLGLSAASIPVAGASGRAAQLMIRARDSVKLAETARTAKDATSFARHMDDAANYMQRAQAWGRPAAIGAKPLAVASVPVMAEGGRQLADNWEHLSGWQRVEQAGMMGLNVAGFASPVFAKGYVRIHNGFKHQYQKLSGSGGPDTAAATPQAPDAANPAGSRAAALAPFQEAGSPLVVPGRRSGEPPRLLGPDGQPIGAATHRPGNLLYGPDGRPISGGGTEPPAPALPTLVTPDAPAAPPRLHLPGAADPVVQTLIVGAPHNIHRQVQEATARGADKPVGAEAAEVVRPATRSARGGAPRSEQGARPPGEARAWNIPEHILIPMELMSRFRSLSRGGFFRSPEVEVLVYPVAKGQRGEAVSLTGKANSMGLLDRNYVGIRWQEGSQARDAAQPRHVFDEFGKPGDGREFVMLLAPKGTHQRLVGGETLEVNAWASDHQSMGLADGPAYRTAPHSFRHGLRGDRGATAYAGNELYYRLDRLLNRALGRQAFGPDPLRYPSEPTAFSVGRRPLPAQDLQSGLVVWDPHNHPNVFPGPHYLQMKNFLERMNTANPSLRVDPQNHITLSYEMIPYRTQMLGGAWAGYTHPDMISINSRFGHRQDLQMLAGWHDLFGQLAGKVGPEEARRQQQLLIPSLTGIETYAVGHPSEYASGIGAHDYLSRALLSYPDAYPMVGEINGRKEMKSLLDGRGNACCRPLSTDIGRTGTQLDEALAGVLDATRESGMVTVLHSDWGAMEFGRDGRPIEAPGDSRDFFKLTRMLMDLGPYDMSTAPKNRPLADAHVRRIVDNGPVRHPARIVLAHLGIGNWVRGSPHHLQLVRWALDHPLLRHVNFDSSWLPSIEMYAGDPGFRQQMVSLIQSGRIFYAGDQTNFQTPEQLLAPWFAQQPLLRAIDQSSPETLRTYASGGFRNLYENSKPDMDWYRYRRATDGSMEAYIRSMPEEAQQRLADWVSRYESAHPALRTDPTQRPAGPTDPQRGRAPYEPRLPMEIRLPRPPVDRPNAYDAEAGSPLTTAFAADPAKPHSLDHFDAWLHATATGRPTPHTAEDVTHLGPSRRLVHGAEVPREPGPLPQFENLPPATHAEIQSFMARPAFAADELAALSQRRADRGGMKYTDEAMAAGRLAAENGAPRGLQLKTMELVDIVSRRQEGNNAYLQARSRKEVAGIALALGAVGSIMLGGGTMLHGQALPHWVGSAALWTRAMSTFLRTGNQQLARKISEGIQEQSIVKPEMLQSLAGRMNRWGPRMGMDPLRFQGDHSLQSVIEQALVDMHYMLDSPINRAGGETPESRRALLHSTFSTVLAAVDREIGVQWTGVEWTNFRTLPGGAVSMAASAAYGIGVLGSLNALGADLGGNWFHVPLVGANALFAGYHMVGAVSGRFGHNWAELPVVRQTLNRGAWPMVSLGTAGWALHSAVAAAGGGSWQQVALNLGTAGFAALASHATYKLTQAGWRAEGVTGQHARLEALAYRSGLGSVYEALQLGGVDKPRAAPLRNLRAGIGLTGLGAMMWMQNAHGDDDKLVRDKGPLTPGPLPGITPSTDWPKPLAPASLPPREPSSGQPPVPLGFADPGVAALLAGEDPRVDGRGGRGAVVSPALAQLIQISPQRGLRAESMTGSNSRFPT